MIYTERLKYATLLHVEYFIDLRFKDILNPLILFLHIKLTICML